MGALSTPAPRDQCLTRAPLTVWLWGAVPQYDLSRLFAPDLEVVGLRFLQFERLLSRFLPRLSAHLSVEQVSPAMFSSVWFLTLFSSFNALDLATTLHLWDRFLCAGWKVRWGLCGLYRPANVLSDRNGAAWACVMLFPSGNIPIRLGDHEVAGGTTSCAVSLLRF